LQQVLSCNNEDSWRLVGVNAWGGNPSSLSQDHFSRFPVHINRHWHISFIFLRWIEITIDCSWFKSHSKKIYNLWYSQYLSKTEFRACFMCCLIYSGIYRKFRSVLWGALTNRLCPVTASRFHSLLLRLYTYLNSQYSVSRLLAFKLVLHNFIMLPVFLLYFISVHIFVLCCRP